MTAKKKKIDFSVRPRKGKEELPPTPEQWVRGGDLPEASADKRDAGPLKRLTLDIPAHLHTAFKARCVIDGVTIQEKVRLLIEKELTVSPETAPAAPIAG